MANSKDKTSLLNWVKTHPKKLIIYLLLIAIPVFVLILAYTNFSKNANKFHFSNSDTDAEYLYKSDLASNRKLNKYIKSLDIKLKEVNKLTNDDGHDYVFVINYEPLKVNYEYQFEAILKANWLKEQTTKSSIRVNKGTNGKDTSNIRFPYDTPNRKLLVFKVGLPSLILKIDVKIKNAIISGSDENITLYYKYDLNKIKYQYDRK